MKVDIKVTKTDLFVKVNVIIPANELEMTASRAGGPGGQHVNKTDTRITIRWNVRSTNVLNEEQKERLFINLASKLTVEGDLIIHNSESRSQQQNKKLALINLADEIRKALHIPKKRKPTKASRSSKESRLQSKVLRSALKKNRSKKSFE